MPRLMSSVMCLLTASCMVVRLSHIPFFSHPLLRSTGGTGTQQSGREYTFPSIYSCVDDVTATVEGYTDMTKPPLPQTTGEDGNLCVVCLKRAQDKRSWAPKPSRDAPAAHDRLRFLKILGEPLHYQSHFRIAEDLKG
ncbi:MAG: hypothetical protein P4L69_17635 [Desulfosporosinus sp.]|nr:hypothetical protein [Desulfosporosinus sp.]